MGYAMAGTPSDEMIRLAVLARHFPKMCVGTTTGLGVSQVITKDMVLEVNYEGITDEGFLNNPYRSYRIR